MPTSAGPFTPARAAVSGPPASEQFHSAPAGPTRSEPPQPLSYPSGPSRGDGVRAEAPLPSVGRGRSKPLCLRRGIYPTAARSSSRRVRGRKDTSGAAFADILLTEIQVLRSEVAASREEEARLREEMSELRTMVAVLDAVVSSRHTPDAPSGEEDE
jgi:hypothetical protein